MKIYSMTNLMILRMLVIFLYNFDPSLNRLTFGKRELRSFFMWREYYRTTRPRDWTLGHT
jgi:hypothetical protein